MSLPAFMSNGLDGMVPRPCAYVKGPLAVARPIGDDRRWMVGHVASGHSCGAIRFRSVRAAKAALRDILPLANWNDHRLLSGSAQFMGPKVYRAILAIASRHGGTDLYGADIQEPGAP